MDRDVEVMYDELSRIRKDKKERGYRSSRPAPESSQFMSLSQVLQIVPVGRSTLYAMINKNEFPSQIKIGHSSYWSKDIVNKWVEDKLNGNSND